MHFITRSFLGRANDFSWSQYWENEPDDQSLVLHRGHLFALVNLSIEDGQASDIGHLLINEINQTYFSSIDVSAPVWLKRTLETISQNPVFKITHLSLMVAVVLDGQLHLCFLNSGVGVLQRGTKISQILSGSDSQVLQISGKLLPSDQFLLCTPTFLNSYSWDKVKSHLSGSTISDIEENFLLDLNSFVDQSLIAGLLVQVHHDTVDTPFIEQESALTAVTIPQNPPKKPFFKSLFPQRSTYISHLDSDNTIKRKKSNIIFSLVVLSILFVSIFFGAKQNKIKQTENTYQSLKSQYEAKINNAIAIKNISLEESQQQARESKEILKQMLPLKVHLDEINKFTKDTDLLLSQTGSADAYKPVNFYDTGLIGSQSNYSKMYLVKNKLYLLDTSTGRIDSVDIGTRSIQKIFSSDIEKNIENFAENNGQIYVLKNKTISVIVGKVLDSKIDLAKEITNFESGSFHFWNGSLYVLAKLTDGTSTIWKFAPNSTGFSPGTVWIKDPKTLPASPSTFAINGQIWVMGLTGQIVPFTHGAADTYKSTSSLTNANNLVTSVDSEVLAYTDKDNLVYVNHKTDVSSAGYNFDKLKILNLAFDGSSNTIFVLCNDQQIYKISL